MAEDDQRVQMLRQGLESGALRMHVIWRRARAVDGFRDALVAEVGETTVKVREHFMKVGLIVLVLWFAISHNLGLGEITVRFLGSPLSMSFISFAILLATIVLVSRAYIKPMQGAPTHRAATASPELFETLWEAGAVALMSRDGPDRICQGPRGDWRAFVETKAL